jgi:YfiH family protein
VGSCCKLNSSLRFPLPLPFAFAVSTRFGGVSPQPFHSLNLGLATNDSRANIDENRKLFMAALPRPLASLAFAQQIHGCHLQNAAVGEQKTPGDGLITSDKSLTLAITIADCYPLMLMNPSSGRFALLHLGWRGVVAGLTEKAVEAFVLAGDAIRDLYFALGPGIGRVRYPVGKDVWQNFPDASVTHQAGHQALLDLGGAIITRLLAVPIVSSRIFDFRLCTYTRDDLFFSYRRDGQNSGRMLAVAWRLEE